MRNWVRSDIFMLGAEHVQEMPLEPDLGGGHAWLTWDKARRPDMFGMGAKHVRVRSLETG
jgi:hypothetical protein